METQEVMQLIALRKKIKQDSYYRSWEDEISFSTPKKGRQYAKLLFAKWWVETKPGSNDWLTPGYKLSEVIANARNGLYPEVSLTEYTPAGDMWETNYCMLANNQHEKVRYPNSIGYEVKIPSSKEKKEELMEMTMMDYFKVVPTVEEQMEEVDRILSDSDSSEQEEFPVEYLAQMGDQPWTEQHEPHKSENHIGFCKQGEQLVGGMPTGKKQKKKGKKKKNPNHRVVLYNPLPSMPDEFDTKIRTFGQILPGGATASVVSQVFTNSLLHTGDDFTASGSNATLANIGRSYTKYRVKSYSIKYTVVSRNTLECNFTEWHSPGASGYAAGVSWQPESATRDKSFYFVIPGNTKSPCVVGASRDYTMMAIVGQEEFKQDDKYYGALDTSGVPSDPTDKTYLTFYAGQTNGSSFTAGTSPGIFLLMEQVVRFYDKRV